jgi:hypothetical protein
MNSHILHVPVHSWAARSVAAYRRDHPGRSPHPTPPVPNSPMLSQASEVHLAGGRRGTDAALRAAAPMPEPIADPANGAVFAALLATAYPGVRMPGPQRFDPTRGDWCICAVPLRWTDSDGWVHLADGRSCPLPRRRQ